MRGLDGAGWHTASGLEVREGIRLVTLPPCTPDLQPAETLWLHVDEPIANRHVDTLADTDATVAAQCVRLHADRNRIKGQSGSPWWPDRSKPNRSSGFRMRGGQGRTGRCRPGEADWEGRRITRRG